MPICQFCAESYSTRLHNCKICEITGQSCFYTAVKYSNYSGNHEANSMKCNTVISARKLDINKDINKTATADIEITLSSLLSAKKK